MNKLSNYSTRLHEAITQVRKECNCNHHNISPVRDTKYWEAIEKAEAEFNISGVKMDMIMDCQIK